jgi:folate-dependent phosphoribosylglycinamide formyltransferase PurN
VLESREIMTGCTVHYVDEKLDSGKIIIKKKFILAHDDNEATLKKKTQFLEYRAFSEAINKIYR